VSNGKEKRKRPEPGDWEVRHKGGIQHIAQARYTRDRDGAYTFTSGSRLIAEFPPGSVHMILPLPVPADPVTAETDKPSITVHMDPAPDPAALASAVQQARRRGPAAQSLRVK
jgi:hypothetical protein